MTDTELQTTFVTHFSPSVDDTSEACLVRIYPHSIGEGIINLPHETIYIGREKKCQIELNDPSVSRQHAQIDFNQKGFTILDLDSCNSTFINDIKIKQHRLASGDLIRIGHTIFKFLSNEHIEKQYHEEIYSMMISDGLTKIPNKRYFLEILDREVSRSQRHQRPLSLIIFDIDHFKQINDKHGHLTGDIILRDLCQRILPYIRKDEIFARYGGEEFIILLPELNSQQAFSFGQKLLNAVNKDSFTLEQVNIPVTISIGIAEFKLDENYSADDLIKAADNKLYAAKNNGRNCVKV
ncbi:MAG: diguanylate cyclase [Gammaproteobacteria bacterium]|nr:diguanylate cyclase [Gammaproteobacteria bacterium]